MKLSLIIGKGDNRMKFSRKLYAIASIFLIASSFAYILIAPTTASGERPQTFNRVILFSWDGTQYNHLMELYNAGSLGNLTELVNATQLPILRTLTTSSYTATNWGHPTMLSGFGRGAVEGALDGVTVWENIEAWNSSWVTGAITAKDKFVDEIFPYQWNDDDIDVRYAQNVYSNVIADEAIEFIQNYSDLSFFLFVHFRDPDSAGHNLGENSQLYTGAIIACDHALGRVLDTLDSEGIRNSTAVIVTTDHGFQEGATEHGSNPWPTGDSNCYTVWIASSHGKVDLDEAANNFWDQDDVAPTIYSLIGLTDYRTRYPYVTGFAIWDRAFDVRDVAVTNITIVGHNIFTGFVEVNVTVENQGNYTEVPTVNVYYDNVPAGSSFISYPALYPKLTKTITFKISTKNIPAGIYTVMANLNIVPAGGTSHPSLAYTINETDADRVDNTLVDGAFKVIDFIDYAPFGMPDFDQRQDLWNDSLGVWTWCAPVAVANSLWLIDSQYETSITPPPTINDTFPLVTNYTVGIDDHDPSNVPFFISHLAYLMDTNGNRTGIGHSGTNVTDTQAGIAHYLSWTGLNPKGDANGDGTVNQTDWNIVNAAMGTSPGNLGWNMAADIWPATLGWPKPGVADNVVNGSDLALVTANMNKTGKFYEQTVKAPDFYFVEKEVERSEDVTLLLGFWQWTGTDWYRENYPYREGSGHAVTVAGVNSTTLQIAISDPIQDNAEPPPQGTSGPGRVIPPPPHPHTGIPETLHNNATYVSHDEYNVTWLSPPLPPNPAGNWTLINYTSPQYPGKWLAVIEWAIVVSPVKVHDVAVVDKTLFKTVIGQGYKGEIDVTVENQGNFTETFTVTVYYKNTTYTGIVGTQAVMNLAAGTRKLLVFIWTTNATVKRRQSYTITANASIVPGEIDTADNSRDGATIKVTIPGDVDGDWYVYTKDLGKIGASWRKYRGDPKYIPNADIDCDGYVYTKDLGKVGANWRKNA